MSPYFGPSQIRKLREYANISQSVLALQSGITKEYLDRIETGVERRWTVRLRPVAVVLNVPVEELVAA
jgi:transcriptional regulator with XRE-family HTH domain